MNAPFAAMLFCLCTQIAAAQDIAASASGPAPGRHADLIKTASAAPRDTQVVRALAPHDAVAQARNTPAEAPHSHPPGERDLLLAGLALMAGIALRRYNAGRR